MVRFTEEILNGKLHFLCSEKFLRVSMDCFINRISTYPTVVLVQMAKCNLSNKSIKDLPCRRHSTLEGSYYSENKYFVNSL